MAAPTIRERIDEIYSSGGEANSEELRAFIGAVQTSHEHASKLFARYALMFVVAWVICYAIGIGMISEGSVAAFKLGNSKGGLITAPIVLGMLTYLMLSKLSFAEYLMGAVEQSYKYRLPGVHEQNLTRIVAYPTIFNVERNLLVERFEADVMNRLTVLWIHVGAICLVVVPLVALVHVSYLLVSADIYTTFSVVLSIVSGIVLWSRGVIVLVLYAAIGPDAR